MTSGEVRQMPKSFPRVCAVTLTAVLFVGSGVGRSQQTEPQDTDLAAGASGAQLMQAAGAAGGLVVHVGSGPAEMFARVTAELQPNERFVVHGLYRGPDNINTVRQELRKRVKYGAVSAEARSAGPLPYAEQLVRVIVASDAGDLSDDELDRVLAPGGVALVRRGDRYTRWTKPRPSAIDDWTHLLYDASNNAVSADRVVGPPGRVHWIAPPQNARHHERLGTVTVVVSAAGKIFYVIDEAPVASILLPPRWALVARDAFSGVLLWKRTISKWEDHLRGFRSGPPELSRTLVAIGGRVYVTLGQRAPVTALDPATGETLQEYEDTDGTEEILHQDGTLYLAIRRGDGNEEETRRGLMAVNAETGSVLWARTDSDPLPMSLTVSDGRVVYMTLKAVVCLSAATGEQIWSTPREVADKRPGWSAPTVVIHDGVVLAADRWTAYKNAIDEVTGKPVAGWLAQEGWTGDLIAYAADTGAELWRCPCAEAYHAPPDVFVADGLVWVGQSRSRTGPDFVAGRDLRTGEIKRQLDTAQAWKTTMPHHRCHRNRATPRFIVTGRTGVEFIDLKTGDSRRHHWTRGTCQFGTLPSNGLLYVPPHACACYIEGKLTGFLALASKRSEVRGQRSGGEKSRALETGPAYGKLEEARAEIEDGESPATAAVVPHSALRIPHSTDWPTYRRDSRRSAYLPHEVPAELGSVWEAGIGTDLTAPVIAEGKVFVAAADAHTIHARDAATGKPVWTFTANGRIDSPPSVAAGRVVFGSADGHVYCLRGSDGILVWRFRAAPAERRIMAYGQLESAWPVHGSVLILEEAVYFVAGRSSYLDGGLVLYRLDLKTGEQLARRNIYSRDPATGEQPDEPIMFELPGALPDVLATDGELVYMRHLAFDPATLAPRPPARHVYSPAGFLNGDWWHRTYWIDGTHFYSGYIGWYFAGHEAPAGRLLVFTDSKLYGYSYTPGYYRGTTGRKYHLFALDRAAQPQQPPADYRRASREYPHRGGGKFRLSFDWSQRVPLLVRAMVLTDGKLFVAGPPDGALTSQHLFAGEEGGRLVVCSTSSGESVKQFRLDALPVYDGMAAAHGKLFLSLQGGRLLCLGAEGKQTTTVNAIKPLEE